MQVLGQTDTEIRLHVHNHKLFIYWQENKRNEKEKVQKRMRENINVDHINGPDRVNCKWIFAHSSVLRVLARTDLHILFYLVVEWTTRVSLLCAEPHTTKNKTIGVEHFCASIIYGRSFVSHFNVHGVRPIYNLQPKEKKQRYDEKSKFPLNRR